MSADWLLQHAEKENKRFKREEPTRYRMPPYHPDTYVQDLTRSPYFDALITLRHFVQAASRRYFELEQGARNVDLFMLTPSISSPMGPGSDSEPIHLEFGGHKTHLVDSSQFGFEPLLFHGQKMVYCYLPSMRGENPDARHLNQFYHCECEMVGDLQGVMQVAEGYVKALSQMLLCLPNVVGVMSTNAAESHSVFLRITQTDVFPRVSFEEVCELLRQQPDADCLIRLTSHGRDLTAEGEHRFAKLRGLQLPFWITHYDRDRVPFYQQPVAGFPDKVENADLIFPALTPTGFGGEVLGCGQRQHASQEMRASLRRQDDISAEPYEWYLALRDDPAYKPTSGFGLGIERFIAWALAKENIRDVSLYPRLKGIRTYP